jgi:hypothetical protein
MTALSTETISATSACSPWLAPCPTSSAMVMSRCAVTGSRVAVVAQRLERAEHRGDTGLVVEVPRLHEAGRGDLRVGVDGDVVADADAERRQVARLSTNSSTRTSTFSQATF